jgi:SAM-dependent methyltransferase
VVDPPRPPAADAAPDAAGVALDPGRVLADADGGAALAALVARLRAIGYDGTQASADAPAARDERWASTIVALARGDAVRASDVVDALGVDDVATMQWAGALFVMGGAAALGARLFPMRSLYTVLPSAVAGEDVVYLGPDSIVLFQRIWSARGYGDRAVDLATGNGFIAAALATRYDHVIAADLSPRCVSTAGLVPVLNPHLRSRFATVQTDVADGLRLGSFDLVTANAPWVPETVGPDGGPPRRFAAGGPTGFELPRRFIDAAAELLAPGGRAFVACLDIGFADGRRPLRQHLPTLSDRGYEVTATESPLNEVFDYGPWARRKAEGAIAARHVVVEVRSPS